MRYFVYGYRYSLAAIFSNTYGPFDTAQEARDLCRHLNLIGFSSMAYESPGKVAVMNDEI
jgi:hypothetical protein